MVAPIVLHQLAVAAQQDVVHVAVVSVDPPDILVGQALQPDLHVVLAAQPVFEHVELQGADHAPMTSSMPV